MALQNTLMLVVLGSSFFLAYIIVTLIREKLKIKRLGFQAPSVTPFWSLGLPFIWEVLQYGLRDENLKFFHNYFFCQNGPQLYRTTLEARVMGIRYIFTADPVNIKAMLSSQFDDFCKGDTFRKDWGDFIGTSIFGADGKHWRHERNLMSSILTKSRVRELSCFERNIQKLVPMLDTNEPLDIKDYLQRFTMDVQAEFSLGVSMDNLYNPEHKFSKAFEAALRTQSLIERTGPLNFLIPRRRFKADIRWARDWVRPIVEEALALSTDELDKYSRGDREFTYLHASAKHTRDIEILTDQVLTILVAGRDSTGLTMTWMFYELARHPEIVAELRQEIEERIGLERAPEYNEMKQMPLLQNIIKETMRLYPVAPLNNRIAARDTTLPTGGGSDGSKEIGIPAGTKVVFSIHLLQLNEMNYPEKTSVPLQQFYPKRWNDWTPKSWTYIPFLAGPRLCIGQDLAMTEMAYVLVRLFQTFRRVELDESVSTVAEEQVDERFPWLRKAQNQPTPVESFIENTPVMVSEILLIPRRPVKVRFYK